MLMGTSFTLTGFAFTEFGNSITTPQEATLTIQGTDDLQLQFNYDPTISNPSEGEFSGDIDNPQGTIYDAFLDNTSVLGNDAYDLAMVRITSNGQTSDLIVIGYDDANFNWTNVVFPISSPSIFGSGVPTTNQVENVLSDLSVGLITSGQFREGVAFSPASLPGVETAPFEPYGATEGDDFIEGYPFLDDIIDGLGGNDTINGGDENDTLIGGAGIDQLDGGDGDDLLQPGTNGDYDVLIASSGNDTIDLGEASNGLNFYDLIYGGLNNGIIANVNLATDQTSIVKVSGTDTVLDAYDASTSGGIGISGTTFNDIFNVTGATDSYIQVAGAEGYDTYNLTLDGQVRLIFGRGVTQGNNFGVVADVGAGQIYEDGFGFSDTINILGGTGRLSLRGTNFGDSITGHDGSDDFIGEMGNDTFDGGAGEDRVRYDRSGVTAVQVDLEAGTATGTWGGEAFTDTLLNIEGVRGSRTEGDMISGSSADNQLYGMGGNDTLSGRAGNDYIDGGDGTDTTTLNVNSDTIIVTENDWGIQIESAEGFDTFTNVENFEFLDTTLSLAQVMDMIVVVPGETIVGGDTDDVLDGTSSGDTVAGGAGNDTINAGGGDDIISASEGDDVVDAGSGNDNVGGGVGNDTINGGSGDDTIGGGRDDDEVDGGDGNDGVYGGPGNDVLFGGSGDDTMGASYGNDLVQGLEGNDSLGGGTGRDTLDGGDDNDSIGGGEGDDSVNGGLGDDFLAGGGRNDVIDGGAGDDRINGGSGDDTITGGAGMDTFIFNDFVDGEMDVILGFENGQDMLRMRGIEGQGLQGRVDALDITNTTFGGQSGVMMEYNGHMIFVEGVSANDMGVEDFIFIG